MAKVFSTNFEGGSYISHQGDVGTPANIEFKRKDRGLTPVFNGTNSKITYSNVVMSGDWAIVVNFKYKISSGHKTIIGNPHYLNIRDDNKVYLFTSGGLYNLLWTRNELNNQFILSKNGTTVSFYANNVFIGNFILADSAETFIFSLIGNKTSTWFLGDVYKVETYDEILSATQRAELFNSFLMTSPKIYEKYPRSMPEMKPTDTSGKQTEGLLLHYNMIPSGAQIVDISGNESPSGLHGNIISTLDGLQLDGKNDYISVNLPVGPAATVKTIAFRIKLATISEIIYEGQSNALLILANAGTLEAADYDHIYINGVEDATVVANQWLNVVITSSTVVDNNTASIGYNSGTFDYGKFEMADFQIWSKEFTATEAASYSNSFIRNVLGKFPDEYDGVGNFPVGCIKGTGTYEITEETSQDSVLKDIDVGTKSIKCTSSGIMSIPNINMPGEIEFDWHKAADANTISIYFVVNKNDIYPNVNGYILQFASNEKIQLLKFTGAGIVFLYTTAVSYLLINTWYRIKLTNNKITGEKAIFVKGGSFGNEYNLVGIATDTTYTETKYLIPYLELNDKIIIR